jgi:pimeloyl-ACP methyl ester carboxylesterase
MMAEPVAIGGSAEPFSVHVDQTVIDDLRRRLDAAQLASDFGNDDWRYGTNGDYLGELVAYWREEFDWMAQERAMSKFSHFRTRIDGVAVHFIHERGKGPNPIPLIATHGWPWTFWDMHKLIGPLTDPAAYGGDPADAFDVVVPSLPGFGFSGPVQKTGVNAVLTADIWVRLMQDVLGYGRFAAHGGDWGSVVTAQMGHKYADRLVGIHLTTTFPLSQFSAERPWDSTGPAFSAAQGTARQKLLERSRRTASHMAVNILDPQSIAYAMQDSPVGLCAWLLERRRAWSDCHGDVETRFSKDELLTHMMIYWVTNTFGTSCRFYREALERQWVAAHDRTPVIEAPTAVSVFLGDLSLPQDRDWYDTYYNLHYVNEWSTGGHFAAAEEPDAVVHDLREAFRSLRK